MLDDVLYCTFALLPRSALSVIGNNFVKNLIEMPILNSFCEYFTFLQFLKTFCKPNFSNYCSIPDNFLSARTTVLHRTPSNFGHLSL